MIELEEAVRELKYPIRGGQYRDKGAGFPPGGGYPPGDGAYPPPGGGGYPGGPGFGQGK